MDENLSKENPWHGTLTSYVIGFILSILLTGAAYLIVGEHLLSGRFLVLVVAGLGIAQAIIQLLFFLHLGKESKPQWNMFVFFAMVFVLIVVVFGSVWIMNDLNSRMMPMMNETPSKGY